MINVRRFSFTARKTDAPHHVVIVETTYRRVEIVISPTGRRAHVYVDGQKWEPADELA